MPTYEYVCEKCGHEFDVFQSMNDPRLESCPVESCDGKVRRKIGTGAGIIFKGSGFYETDYRSDSYKAGEKKETGASSDSKDSGSGSSKPEKSSGEKPAAKPAASGSGSSSSPSKASGSSTSGGSDS